MIATLLLVLMAMSICLAGRGSAVIAAAFLDVGIGLLGVSLAFGLTVLTMAYSIGRISGCHLNPAVTVGLAAGGRFPTKDIGPQIAAQVIGAIVAATVLYLIASGAPGFDLAKGFAAHGYSEHSPGKYGMMSGLLAEVVLTMMFLFVIMGATHGKAPVGFAPIGLGLTLTHLVGGWALAQLWLFWVAPPIGGMLGGILYRWPSEEPSAQVTGVAPAALAE
jgi:aquaporin Z